MNKISENLKEFYNKGGLQYFATSLGKDKQESISDKEKQNISILESKKIEDVNTDNNTKKERVISSEIKQDNKNKQEENIELKLVINENTEISPVNENTDKLSEKQEELLKDIKEVVKEENKEQVIKVDDFGDIFKKNDKLLKLINNSEIIENKDHLIIDGKYISYISFYSKNKDINIDLLSQFDNDNNIGEFTIHTYLEPQDSIVNRIKLEKKLRALKSSRAIQFQKTGDVTTEIDLAIKEINGLIYQLASQEVKMYRVFNIIRLHGDTLQEIKDKLEYLKILFKTMNLEYIGNLNLQIYAHEIFGGASNLDNFKLYTKQKKFKGITTTHNEIAGIRYIFTNEGNVGDKESTYPHHFLYRDDNSTNGILLGQNLFTGKMISRDFWCGDNYNMVISGVSGTGKSYTCKLVNIREYIEGVKQIIIDPDNEFEQITQTLGGKYVNIGKELNDQEKINPFDFIYPRTLIKNIGLNELEKAIQQDKNIYLQKLNENFNIFIDSLKTLLDIILINEKLDKDYFKELSGILNNFFIEKRDINRQDILSFFKLSKNPLNFIDFYNYLNELYEKETNIEQKKLLLDIKKGLYDYGDINGSYVNIFGKKQTGLNFDLNWTAFNLKHLGKTGSLRLAVVFMIMDFIETIFREKHKQQVRLTLDEATTFIGDKVELAKYIVELYKRARKYNIGVTLIVQGVDNLFMLNKEFGSIFLQNSENLILLSQKLVGLKAIEEHVGLKTTQLEFLKNISSEQGEKRGKALVITGKNIDQVQILSEEYIHKFITTDPKENRDN